MTPTAFGMRPSIEGLTVVGEAAQDAQPDIVELGFEIHSLGLSAALAIQENVSKATHIGQVLTATRNAQTDVKTSGVEVLPILQLPNPPAAMMPALPMHTGFGAPPLSPPMVPALSENPNLIGYHAVSSIKVTVRDLNRVGDVVDVATRAGAIPNGSLRFLLQDEATLERNVLEEAVRRAQEKATTLASAVGKSTGNPISISEEVTTYQPRQLYGNGRQHPFPMGSVGSNVRLPFAHGQLTFYARVSMVYQLP